MSKFNRTWTLQIAVNKTGFSRAFNDVVNTENQFVLDTLSSADNTGTDFFGTLQNDTFTIWKRQGLLDPDPNCCTLNGKIVVDGESVILNLKLINNYPIGFKIKAFLVNIVTTAVLFFILTRTLWLIHLKSGNISPTYLIISIPVLFVLGFVFQAKIIRMYLSRLISSYNEVLGNIGRRAI